MTLPSNLDGPFQVPVNCPFGIDDCYDGICDGCEVREREERREIESGMRVVSYCIIAFILALAFAFLMWVASR